jgi:hypothetical protein
MSLSALHEILHRLIEKYVQRSEEDGEIEQVQQDLLPVDVKW